MSKNNNINILIADDHQIVIDGLSSLIKNEKHINVVAEAKDGKQVLDILEKVTIDIAILDIEMPKLDGVQTTLKIKELYPDIKIIILTMYNKAELIKNIISAGADGYILKNKGKEELVKAINIINDGEEYFGDEVTKTLITDLKQKEKQEQLIRLTRREKEVLKLIADGKTTPQISKILFIAPPTVETHRRNLIDKTGVPNSKGLVKFALLNNYI
ncbi:response regulator transcription factor [Tenacibaculum agarivorans]|uniref:response regulator transcription factor n=1 Tax=Tenacibaculum agarivorans TaxID=1908389 RepID=UPI00094B9A0A|nr:response regulator transcription factor [Tenacibaculum agarivorans]